LPTISATTASTSARPRLIRATDDNRRHRRGQNDAEDGIFAAETEGPADVIKPLMNTGDASDGVDEHRPEYREES